MYIYILHLYIQYVHIDTPSTCACVCMPLCLCVSMCIYIWKNIACNYFWLVTLGTDRIHFNLRYFYGNRYICSTDMFVPIQSQAAEKKLPKSLLQFKGSLLTSTTSPSVNGNQAHYRKLSSITLNEHRVSREPLKCLLLLL